MYDKALVPIQYMAQIDANGEKARGDIYRFIYVNESRKDMKSAIEAAFTENDQLMDKYRALDLTDEQKAAVIKFDTAWPKMKDGYRQLMDDAEAGDTAAVNAALLATSDVIKARTETFAAVDLITKASQQHAQDLKDEAASTAATSSIIIIIATIIAIVVSIILAIVISRSIVGPVNMVRETISEIHLGHLGNRLKLTRKDEIGDMAGKLDDFADDLQKYVIGTLKMIAEGDLSRNLKVRDDKDEIVPAMVTTIETLHALIQETKDLSQKATEGQLSARGNVDKFKGGYRDIVLGINQTLEFVINPMNEGVRVCSKYADGDFTTRVSENLIMKGDFMKFKNALNAIGEKVSKALQGVSAQVTNLAAGAEEANASVEEVSVGAGLVAKNAAAVSANADKTSHGIEQVQKAMEDLARTIQDVANKAEMVAKIVDDTAVYSKEGMDLSKKTESGMQGITKSSNEVNQIILEIKGQMDKISEIVNLITDLANQTNLLALNAAIEAARAGDAGRGFAVVATEVKSLAVESRASAEKIAEMIDNLQKQTNHAVEAVVVANTGVKEGSEALRETLTSFGKIVSSVDQISKNVSDVAAASEEQAASVEEVTANINEVNKLMESTVKEATDAAAASEESSAAIDQITKVIGNVNVIVDQVTKEISRFKC